MIEWKKTDRGFTRGEFKDRYGEPCSIQKSSFAVDDAIWLGRDSLYRMHLTRDMVAALLPVLKLFVETGKLFADGGVIREAIDKCLRAAERVPVTLQYENEFPNKEIARAYNIGYNLVPSTMRKDWWMMMYDYKDCWMHGPLKVLMKIIDNKGA